MAQRIVEVLGRRPGDHFAGRDAEIALLLDALDGEGPTVAHVHGVAGIGKSRLLEAFAARARVRGATVLRLDCRAVAPTPAGFVAALGDAAGLSTAASLEIEAVLGRLGRGAGPVILTLDTYELFATLDAWLRTEFVPLLEESTRVVLAGREPPVAQWLTNTEWRGTFRPVQLGPLTESEALGLLADFGVAPEVARRINGIARGHPLALTMSAAMQAGRVDRDVEDVAVSSVDQIAHEYLAQVSDRATREVLEASSVIRRATEPLIGAMLPDLFPADALDRLRTLPFVEPARDGLVIHDAVRDAIATSLMTTAPERHRRYRIGAWRHLQTELANAPPEANMWRLTADLLYLLKQPDVHDSFFPTGAQPVAIEPARPEDERDFDAIVERHEGPESQRALRAWWEFAPQSVKMVRGREGEPRGFTVFSAADQLDRRVATRDPIASLWLEHHRGRTHGGRALFIRRWLDRDFGDGPEGPTFGAFNLDVKRTYVEMRPRLRDVYTVAREYKAGVLERLQWFPLSPDVYSLDGVDHLLVWLDMGPASVEGWLSMIIAKELEVGEEALAPYVDLEAHELQLADRRVALTPLEAGFVACLLETPGRVVSRADLVERVWGYRSDATSNVVDSLVRGLRRKLGPDRAAIETVRGAGYRYRSVSAPVA